MAINPYRKGGPDVPVVDGGTGASDASTARTNIGAGDLTTAAHATVNHAGIPGVGGPSVHSMGFTYADPNGTNPGSTVPLSFGAPGVPVSPISGKLLVISVNSTSGGTVTFNVNGSGTFPVAQGAGAYAIPGTPAVSPGSPVSLVVDGISAFAFTGTATIFIGP